MTPLPEGPPGHVWWPEGPADLRDGWTPVLALPDGGVPASRARQAFSADAWGPARGVAVGVVVPLLGLVLTGVGLFGAARLDGSAWVLPLGVAVLTWVRGSARGLHASVLGVRVRRLRRNVVAPWSSVRFVAETAGRRPRLVVVVGGRRAHRVASRGDLRRFADHLPALARTLNDLSARVSAGQN